MKRLTATEQAGLLLAANFIAFGVYSVMEPVESYVSHPGSGFESVVGHDPPPEHVTRNTARIYGFALIVLGAGIAWLALYRPRK